MSQLGFLGGTGDLGKALAIHLADDYEKTVIGSREKSKAEQVVKELQTKMAGRAYLKDKLVPATNQEVAERCDIIIASLPAKHAVQEVKELAGHFRGNQLLISTAAPTPKVGGEYLPSIKNGKGEEATSITMKLKHTVVLDSIKLATAFQTVPAEALMKEKRVEADIPITSEDKESYERTADVVRKIEGLRPLYLGSLELSSVAEGLTSVLLNVAKHNNMLDPTVKFVSATTEKTGTG